MYTCKPVLGRQCGQISELQVSERPWRADKKDTNITCDTKTHSLCLSLPLSTNNSITCLLS